MTDLILGFKDMAKASPPERRTRAPYNPDVVSFEALLAITAVFIAWPIAHLIDWVNTVAGGGSRRVKKAQRIVAFLCGFAALDILAGSQPWTFKAMLLKLLVIAIVAAAFWLTGLVCYLGCKAGMLPGAAARAIVAVVAGLFSAGTAPGLVQMPKDGEYGNR